MRWPEGAQSSGVHCGIKRRKADLGALVFDEPVAWAGVFTTNAAAAAPVRWCRDRLGSSVRAVVVNSGNANACTGDRGVAAVHDVVSAAAEEFHCDPEEVLVASTGPIGVPLPTEKITGCLPLLFKGLEQGLETFAGAILTTDTAIKIARVEAGPATVVGVAKGAAMIAPNMATMLAFLVTDADAPAWELQQMLEAAVDRSFNRISIDGCESTNDSVFLFSTGSAPYNPERLSVAVESACAELAKQIVLDAEGGTKLIEIRVEGARDEAHAVALGRAVATSDLWRAAVHGADPNWGRILSALGSSDRGLDLGAVTVKIGSRAVFERGEPTGETEAAAVEMISDKVTVTCILDLGNGSARFLCPDLSEEYVTLNAEVTT